MYELILNFLKKFFPRRYRPAFLFYELIHKPAIKSGPFRGTYYDAEGLYSAKLPKIAGTYEKELQAFFQKDFLHRFDCFIDVGAAEGYYAIGVASVQPNLPVVAYESNMINRTWMDYLAQKNNLANRIQIKKTCSSLKFKKEVNQWNKPFVLIDIEGGEYELLDRNNLASFTHVTFLIELHDFIFPFIEEELKNRFGNTHEITIIYQQKRSVKDLPLNLNSVQSLLFRKASFEIMNEKRPATMKWLYLAPKHE